MEGRKKLNEYQMVDAEKLLQDVQQQMHEDINLAFRTYFLILKILKKNHANLNAIYLRVLFDKLVTQTNGASSHTLFAISYCYFHGWGPEKSNESAKKYYYLALPRLWQEWQAESLCGKALFQKLWRLEEFSSLIIGSACNDGYIFSAEGCAEAPHILATMKNVVEQLKGLLLAFQGNIFSRTKKNSIFVTSPLTHIFEKLKTIHEATAKEIFTIVLEILTLVKKYPNLKEAFQPFIDFNVQPLALQQIETIGDTFRLPPSRPLRLNLSFLGATKPAPSSSTNTKPKIRTSTTGIAGPSKTT